MIVNVDILGQAIKCFMLNSWSIIIIIFVQPLLVGRLIIKLIEMSFHLWSRVGSGFRRPLYVLCKALACQHMWQLEIYLYVMLCICG